MTKKEITGGTCYQDAFRFLFENAVRGRKGTWDSSMVLVHGTVYSPYYERRIKHAWIEFDSGYVLDAASGNLFRPDTWKDISKARRLQVYTANDAMINAMKFEHYGPWAGHMGVYPKSKRKKK